MVTLNGYLMIFALGMMGCVLATPLVTQVATWVGAIDRPDQFRRIHRGAIPRLGGLGLALGIAAGVMLPHLSEAPRFIGSSLPDLQHEWAILAAVVVILAIGFIDDTRSIGPRIKLMGQVLAVFALYLGGIRIQTLDVLSFNFDLTYPNVQFSMLGAAVDVALPSLLVSMFWFLGCMNVWNLIDGMDGLASGVGLLVSGTLTLVAIHNENTEVAILAVALAGSLAGFLLYNWHPACIFLGDSGALLIGLLIGVIGVQGSMKGPSAISILFPILAMGLPISDTAMAIFRRWVRNLPLSAADRRHVHHLLIGLGLNQRQAALMLYCFSGFLCGAVLLGVALRSEFLALVLGISGCLAFLVVVTSRRDELANLRDDLQERLMRGRQERQAAKLTWEAIQRIELCDSAASVMEIIEQTAQSMGCGLVQVDRADSNPSGTSMPTSELSGLSLLQREVSRPEAIFRLPGGPGSRVIIRVEFGRELDLAADIVFRYLQRLNQAAVERLDWLQSLESEAPETSALIRHATGGAESTIASSTSRPLLPALVGVVRRAFGPRTRMVQTDPKPCADPLSVVEPVTGSTGLARR
jgi:UDP-GlcNAc:undecaprenyl-phosphate GlcNAc-1-phosphate transferase